MMESRTVRGEHITGLRTERSAEYRDIRDPDAWQDSVK